MSGIPPLRVDIAILVLLAVAAALVFALLRAVRRRRPSHGIRIDLVGSDAEGTQRPPGR